MFRLLPARVAVLVYIAALNATVLCAAQTRPATQPLDASSRIVFIGDSITDGWIYPALVRQALREAGRPVPTCINAGISGDVAAGVMKRIDRDVLVHEPTLATLSIGVNDSSAGMPVEKYERQVGETLKQLQAAGVPVILLTPTPILGETEHVKKCNRLIDGYITVLRRFAEKHDYPVAEVNAAMKVAIARGEAVLDSDGVHPSFAGHRVMARAVLDAMGFADVPVPEKWDRAPMPGLIREWRIRAAPIDAKPLDDAAAAALPAEADGDGWKPLTLPREGKGADWWLEGERQLGVAMNLQEITGEAKRWYGVAHVDPANAHKACLNIGADLAAMWVNGKRVYTAEGWKGWHAGRERVMVDLKAGRNDIVIECGASFFLSLTDDNRW